MSLFYKKIFNKSAMACVLLAMSFSGVAQDVVIKKVANVPADFIKGADISTLIDVEKHGGKFFDQN
ncbi:galactosidase, partial [Rahnella perminowiae]|nr:galactosidase [Rahnella perminowiae]